MDDVKVKKVRKHLFSIKVGKKCIKIYEMEIELNEILVNRTANRNNDYRQFYDNILDNSIYADIIISTLLASR